MAFGVGLGGGDAFGVGVVVVLAAVGVGLGVAAGGLPTMVAAPATATHLSRSWDAPVTQLGCSNHTLNLTCVHCMTATLTSDTCPALRHAHPTQEAVVYNGC